MPNSKDANLTDHTSVLLIGGIGTGKTSQYRTLPGRGFIYIFDPNALASLKNADIEYEQFSPDLLDINVKPLSSKKSADKFIEPKEPVTYARFEEHLDAFLDNALDGSQGYRGIDDFDWIGLDSFTTFSDAVMDRVLYLNDRLGKHPEQADWTAQMTTVQNVVRTLASRKRLIVCTAHEEMRQEEETGKVYFQPVLTGRLRLRIPALFSDIFRCEAEKDDAGKAQFYLVTVPDKKHQYIRTSIDDLETDIQVTIDKKDPHASGLGALLKAAGRLEFLDRQTGKSSAKVVPLSKGKRR